MLNLLREIRDGHGTAILFITHDLGVVAELCDWVYVIYAGVIVEQGSVEACSHGPATYTQALLRSTPTVRTAQAGWCPGVRSHRPGSAGLPLRRALPAPLRALRR